MCGGTIGLFTALPKEYGLSPRVRGNQSSDGLPRASHRSIPACAGEPAARPSSHRRSWVYPRVCGGTGSLANTDAANTGLSPRVRGNRDAWVAESIADRSIPACAAEPRRSRAAVPAPGVYPRVCGGTGSSLRSARQMYGLSPRVRGNHPFGDLTMTERRSIPACAGEPNWSGSDSRQAGVYPRVCGGTDVLGA